jgi:hypothetical protein
MPVTVPDWVPGVGGAQLGPSDQPATPPDTSTREALGQALASAHGGPIGQPSQVLTKLPGGQTQGTGFYLYTFADGSSIEINDTGQSQNYKQSTQANQAVAAQNRQPTTIEEQKQIGSVPIGNKVYQPDPNNPGGPWIEAPSSQTTTQLTNVKTAADTALAQAQAKVQTIDAQLKSDPTNIALQQAKDQAAIDLSKAQTASQQATAAATAAKTPSEIAQNEAQAALQRVQADVAAGRMPSQIDLDQAQAAYQRQQAVTAAGTLEINQAKLPGEQQLTAAQAQNQLAAAKAALAKAGEPTLWNTGTTSPTNTYFDPKTGQPVTVPNAGYVPTDPGRMTIQLKQQADAYGQQLQQQVAQGKLSPDAAAGQFDKWYATNIEPMKPQIAQAQAAQQADLASKQAQTGLWNAQAANYPASLAETASSNAQKNLVSMLPYVTGKGFDQAFGKALSGGWQNMSPQDVAGAATYSLPNLQEVGRQGAAAALANISPTAQAHLNAPGPPGQEPVGGMPDLSSLLGRGQWNFGAPPGAPAAGAPAGAPAGPTPDQLAAQVAAGGQITNLGAFSGGMPSLLTPQPQTYGPYSGSMAAAMNQYNPGLYSGIG